MADVRFITYKARRIVLMDMTGLRDIEEGVQVIEETTQIIKRQEKKSVLLLTDVTNAHYNTQAAKVLKKFSVEITPYVIASAAVGVTGIKKIILQSMMRLSGREIKIFPDRDSAKDWLIEKWEEFQKTQ